MLDPLVWIALLGLLGLGALDGLRRAAAKRPPKPAKVTVHKVDVTRRRV